MKEQKRKDKDFLLISFFITDPEGLRKIESHWKKKNRFHSNKFLGRSKKDTEKIRPEDLGGSVALVDLNRLDKGFLAEVEVPVATGMLYDPSEKGLFVGSASTIKKVIDGRIVDDFSHPLFNDIHTITKGSDDNVMVTSTGIDAVLEVKLGNPCELAWGWLATEHGYSHSPEGNLRKVSWDKDYRGVNTATIEHTTHVNSCLTLDPDEILATLFHQGEVVKINKKTGKVNAVLSGMRCPHHIRRAESGYLVSDTRNERVLLLDEDYEIIKEIRGRFDWVQDAVSTDDGKIIVVGDSNNGRIVKTNLEGDVLGELRWDRKKRKIDSFLKVEEEEVNNIFKQSF